MKRNFILSTLMICTILLSCNNKTEEPETKDSGLIEITKEQFESEKMKMGEPMLHPFLDLVHVTGNIMPDVNGLAQISLPVAGLIGKITCKPGQNVAKGTVLFEISGHELIDMQKDFAESSAVLKRLQSEFDRVKELHSEKIGTQKELSLAESAFYAENARYSALKTKLENMGLDVSLIEKGTFFSSYFIKSPINGYVSSIDATNGQYVEPQNKIAEIVDTRSYQIKFSVFERDINKVNIGQTVNYYLNGDKSKFYHAEISSVGKIVRNETKSIDCYAAIENSNNMNLAINQYIEGEVIISVDSVLSVPQTAIIKSGDDRYVLVFENESDAQYSFRKVKVAPGRTRTDFVELTGQLPSNKILIDGMYNLQVE